jgi:hypothetical protein
MFMADSPAAAISLLRGRCWSWKIRILPAHTGLTHRSVMQELVPALRSPAKEAKAIGAKADFAEIDRKSLSSHSTFTPTLKSCD